jgi:hypothetical protein
MRFPLPAMATGVLALVLLTPSEATASPMDSAAVIQVEESASHQQDGSAETYGSAGGAESRRWSYTWQQWDTTNYRSHATCMARGRQILNHYPDVQQVTCRKPPRCPGWRLFTYRKQWI